MSLSLLDGLGNPLATIETDTPSSPWTLISEGITTAINNVTCNLVTAVNKPPESTQSEEVVTGYVAEEELEQLTEETVDIPANFAGMEAVMVPTRLRDQLFEITEVVEGEEYVEVTAMHIFYRQRANSTTWTPSKTTKYSCAAICRNVMNNVVFDLGFNMATDCTDQLWGNEFDYARKNLAEIFLDPESGICKRFDLSLIRDNMVFYCLKNVGYDRGFVIEDGKNLLGVERTESIEDVVTRICPLGRDANGNLVWMNYDSKNYVDSSRIGNYSSPKLEIWQTDIRIGEDDVTAANIHEKLHAAALKRFSDDKVDRPTVEMTIQFLSLGDTEEYQQYRNLDRVYLYDIIHIKDSRRGYSYEAQVIGIQHNILTGVLESVTIGTPKKWNGVRTVAVWQVPEVDGRKIRQNTIHAGSFVENAIHDGDISSGAIDGRHFGGGGSSKVKELCVEQLIVENTSEDGLLHTRFAVTEGLIQAEVSRAQGAEGSLGTLVSQTAEAITLEATRATNAENSLSGRITVEAGKITQIVSAVGADGEVTAASIVLAINESDGSSEARIDAGHVYIGNSKSTTVIAGKLNTSDLGAKIADLASVTMLAVQVTGNTACHGALSVGKSLAVNGSYGITAAGTGNFSGVKIGSYSAFTDCVTDASVSGNTLTLTKASGGTVTFSKATNLTGAWSGGIFTVTASPQGSTISAGLFSVAAADITWNGNTATFPVYANLQGGETRYNTGKTLSIDASRKAPASGSASGRSGSSYDWTFAIKNSSGTTIKNLTIDCSLIYSDARSGYYTKAQYDANYNKGWNDLCDILGATRTGDYTRYSGTWYGTLYVAPTGGATAVNNCVGNAKSYSFSRK